MITTERFKVSYSAETDVFIVGNIKTKKYIKLGLKEAKYLFFRAGIRDMEPIMGSNISMENYDCDKELSRQQQQFLDEKFIEWGLTGAEQKRKKERFMDFSMIKLVDFNPTPILNHLTAVSTFFFSPMGVVLFFALEFVKYFFFIQDIGEIGQVTFTLRTEQIAVMDIVVCVIMLLFSMVIHELAHACMCKKYGGEVSKIGLVLFYLGPCLYCDVSDIYMLQNKKMVRNVAGAGLYMNLYFGCIAYLVFHFLLRYHFFSLGLLLFNFANIGLVLINLIPFVKYDGYWILSSFLKIDNLMDKSVLLLLMGFFNHKEFFNIRIPMFKKVVMGIYGLIALVFKPLFWLKALDFVYELLNQNVILRIVIIAMVALIVASDLCKNVKRYRNLYQNRRYIFV